MENEHQKNLQKNNGDVITGIASQIVMSGQKVQIFPAAQEWYGADGRGPYRLPNPDSLIEASLKSDLLNYAMIDRDHARQLAKLGTEVKAAGWFKSYEKHADGSIWGIADWSPRAQKELEDKEYRYFSASFLVDKNTRNILAITGGSLTNTPNFTGMHALAAQEKLTQKPSKENSSMTKEQMEALAKSLGLDPQKTTAEEILAAVEKSKTQASNLEEGFANITKALKLDDKADVASVISAINKSAEETASKQKVDPEEFVPRKMFDDVASRLKDLEKSSAAKIAEEAVAAAMKAGKIAPAQKAWAEEYASANPQGFKDFVENAPVILTGDETAAAQKFAEDNDGLTESDIEVAKQLGIPPETLKEKKKDA